MIAAKIKSRNVFDKNKAPGEPSRRYNFETKEIVPGGEVHWPNLTFDRIESRAEALKVADQRGYVLVRTWDEAIKRAGLYSHDGYYHTYVGCPCPSEWCLNHSA